MYTEFLEKWKAVGAKIWWQIWERDDFVPIFLVQKYARVQIEEKADLVHVRFAQYPIDGSL